MQLRDINFSNTNNQTANRTLIVRDANVSNPGQNNQNVEASNL